jgi:glycosyltransferase involved in cell wall biosynthesis
MLVARMIRRAPDDLDFSVAVLDTVGPLGERLVEEGVPVRQAGRRPGVDWALVGRLRRILAELRPEVVHCHQYTPWFYGGWAAAGLRLPVVFTEHGRHQPDRPRVRRILFNRWLLRHTGAVTAVSGSIVEALVRNEKIPRDRIELLYNGVDHELLAPDGEVRTVVRESLGLDEETVAIGHAGRLVGVKNQALLLRSLARLGRELPGLSWKAFLAGAGPLQAELEDLRERLGLDGRVVFLGQRDDVPRLLNAFDLFALSSFSEGTSVTLLEAMATGVPVVATAVGGNPELVEDGVHGLLVPSDDTLGFALALRRLCSDANLRWRMGAACRQRVEERFTQRAMAEGFARIYREVAVR